MADRLTRLAASVWFRGLVTALLLGVVLTQVDFSTAGKSLADAQWEWVAAAVGLMGLAIVVGGARLRGDRDARSMETPKTVHEGVRAMRQSIQHADERIVKEQRVAEGKPLFPAITNDGIDFARDHVFHGELAGPVACNPRIETSQSG